MSLHVTYEYCNIISTTAADDTQNCTTQPPVSEEDLDQEQIQYKQQPERREYAWRPRPGKGVLVNDGE